MYETCEKSVRASRFFIDQPCAGVVLRTVAPPLRLGATPVAIRREAPALGQHTGEVLTEAGYAPEDVRALREAGVVS